MSNSLGRISEAEMLNPDTVAIIAPNFTVFNFKPDLGTSHAEVTDMPVMSLRMHSSCRTIAVMADWAIAKIGAQFYQSRIGLIAMNILFDNFHSHKGQIPCYTKIGHCATPFMLQVPVRKKLIARKTA